MIENDAQLAATLDYIAKWADTLEGMRLHEVERNGGVFPTIVAGPLHEIRINLEAARTFAHAGSDVPALRVNSESVYSRRRQGRSSPKQTIVAGG